MKTYYYIYRYGHRAPERRHENLEGDDGALEESERLARANPGVSFEILQCIGVTKVTNTQTTWADGVLNKPKK